MGGEHRLSRDPRLRQESGGRPARIPHALPGGIVRFASSHPVTLIGIDVGEDFLDLAIIHPRRNSIELTRVAVGGIEAAEDAIAPLSTRLSRGLDSHPHPMVALIDSPRWPSDCDSRMPGVNLRSDGHTGGRHLDRRLREFTAYLAQASGCALPLSLFATPRIDYFHRCAADPSCKPHLQALRRQLFGGGLSTLAEEGPRGGAIFTRFMLAGFAAYRALDRLGVATFEAYPDLQFRLWRDGLPLAPKRSRRQALADRHAIAVALGAGAGLAGADSICTLDQADAAILALSAYAALDNGGVAIIEEPDEGRFAVALSRMRAAHAKLLAAGPQLCRSMQRADAKS